MQNDENHNRGDRQIADQNGVPKVDAKKIASEVQARYEEESAPRVALMGLTGVGKSSTVNALFDAGREIGEVLPCTKEPGIVHTSIDDYRGCLHGFVKPRARDLPTC